MSQQVSANNMEELELALEFAPYPEEIKQNLRENSPKIFEFNSYLHGKYPNVRQEILDQRISGYIQTEMMEKQLEPNMENIENIITEFANYEGYDKSEEVGEALASILEASGMFQ